MPTGYSGSAMTPSDYPIRWSSIALESANKTCRAACMVYINFVSFVQNRCHAYLVSQSSKHSRKTEQQRAQTTIRAMHITLRVARKVPLGRLSRIREMLSFCRRDGLPASFFHVPEQTIRKDICYHCYCRKESPQP